MAKEINAVNFDNEVSLGTVVVDFWAPWCGPCLSQAPILDQLGQECPEVRILKVNVDSEDELARRYNVMNIPTLIVFKDGVQHKKAIGRQDLKSLKDMVN